MGYVPPLAPPPRLNVDRFGLPRDYATYIWLRYKRHVVDQSPERLAFLHGPNRGGVVAPKRPDPGKRVMM